MKNSGLVVIKRVYISDTQLNILRLKIPHGKEESYLTFSIVYLLKANRGTNEH